MTAIRTGLAVAALLGTGCVNGQVARRHYLPPPARESRAGAPNKSSGPAPALSASAPQLKPEVARAIAAASSLIGQRTIEVDGIDYGSDCFALVRAAFDRSGRPLPARVHDVASLYALAEERGAITPTRRPAPGDLVFMSDRPNGPPAHVGLVASTEPDGTVFVLHRLARGVQRIRLNLAYPVQPSDPATGKHINDTLIVNARALTAGSLVVGVSDYLRRG